MSETISLGTGLVAVPGHELDSALDDREGQVTVWFLSGSVELRGQVTGRMPDQAAVGDLGARLDLAADQAVDDLLNADRQVLSDESDRLAWSASLIGDRSPYAGDLQLNVARYQALDAIVREGGRHVFVVDDPALAWALAQTALLNGLAVVALGGMPAKSSPVAVLRARASAVKKYVGQWWSLRKRRRKRPAPWAELADCDVMVVDWARGNTFSSATQTARTTNLGRMAEVLRSAGLRVGFLATPLSWIDPFDAIADNATQAHDPVVLPEDCIGICGLLQAAYSTWRLGQRLKGQNFCARGVDMSPLFELERAKDQMRAQSTQALAFSCIADALACKGVRPKAFVYPFECQGWERALTWGMRHALPNTRVVAYQHAPFARRYIGFFPPQSDVSSGRVADSLVVMGPCFADLFAEFGWPRERIALGGSLRFEPALSSPPEPAACDGQAILVATSIALDETLDLALKAAHAIQTLGEARMIVNFHPVVDRAFRDSVHETLLKAVGPETMARIELSGASAIELIQQVNVLLYNTSGAVFDACFAGVTVVHVSVDGQLSYDKMPEDTAIRVHSAEELCAALAEIFADRSDVQADLSIGGIVAPVDEAAIVAAVKGT